MKLLRLWLLQIRYAATRELMFRASFFVWVGVELAWFVIQLAFIGVIYHHVDEVAGWNRNQMIILVATNQLVIQIFTAFLMPGLSKLPELVRTGGRIWRRRWRRSDELTFGRNGWVSMPICGWRKMVGMGRRGIGPCGWSI